MAMFGFAQQTQIQYLSGKGLDDTVTWDFLCSDGQNSGKWSHIQVPSQWELQGFGEYTYGRWYVTKGKQPSKEKGTYRYKFSVPKSWQGQNIKIVFDGVMTDTEVLINGRQVGPKHQGGFYRFSYNVTDFIKIGKSNQLEVRVSKHSDNASVNAAERKADWWLFGGIYRPVWLEATPQTAIEHVAVDAKANGDLNLDITLTRADDDMSVKAEIVPLVGADSFASQMAAVQPTGEKQRLTFHWNNVKAWNIEDPQLYNLKLSLCNAQGSVVHVTNTRIGFRTVELRPRDGLYVNDTKVILKGINRHSFHPDGGRTTSKAISISDVLLLKNMNVNAVRSHYPPDSHFLDACDSLGIFVMDELAGWQNAYDNEVGPILQREMVQRDVNHPSILIWSNGNEGGWNYNLDAHFADYDPQHREVVHPWADFGNIDTHHYPTYLTGVGRFTNGYKVFMPTEFMHAMYDQGGGAGLEDFWLNYMSHPMFAGGFIWAFVDEAVRRSDKNGQLDSENYNAPDGVVGPYREREASSFTLREVWSPIQFKPLFITPSFSGDFKIQNNFFFTNTDKCTMKYKLLSCKSPLSNASSTIVDEGTIPMPNIEPGYNGCLHLDLPSGFFEADVLQIEAFDQRNYSIGNWSWPIHFANEYLSKQTELPTEGKATFAQSDTTVSLMADGVEVSFSKSNGQIVLVKNKTSVVPFNNGPIAVGMKIRFSKIAARTDGADALVVAHYLGGIDSIVWRMSPNGLLNMDAVMLNRATGGQGFDDAFTDNNIYNFGLTFSYPENIVTGMKWFGRGPYRVWKNRIKGTNYDIWHKAYNNTITGESRNGVLEYPEFKGYHANIYWASIEGESPFTVYSATDGLFMKVFNPQEPSGRQNGDNTMPIFCEGDISFLFDIPAIRSFKPTSQQGPHSQPGNIRIKNGDEGLRLNLTFDFKR